MKLTEAWPVIENNALGRIGIGEIATPTPEPASAALSMTTDPLQSGGAEDGGRPDRLRVLASGSPPLTTAGTLMAGGPILRVAVRTGNPKWPS